MNVPYAMCPVKCPIITCSDIHLCSQVSRAPLGRATTTCSGMITTLTLTSCSSWPTSCATPTSGAPGASPSPPPPTTPTWSPSELGELQDNHKRMLWFTLICSGITWSRRSTTAGREVTCPGAARTGPRQPWPGPSSSMPTPRKSCTLLKPALH